jgi:hypothetical protein
VRFDEDGAKPEGFLAAPWRSPPRGLPRSSPLCRVAATRCRITGQEAIDDLDLFVRAVSQDLRDKIKTDVETVRRAADQLVPQGARRGATRSGDGRARPRRRRLSADSIEGLTLSQASAPKAL